MARSQSGAGGSAAAGSVTNATVASNAAIDATKIADGSVTSAEFQRLDATSSIQTQLDAKANLNPAGTLSGVLIYTCNADNTAISNGSFGTISGMTSQDITLTAGTYRFQIVGEYYATSGTIGALQFSAYVNSTEVATVARNSDLDTSNVRVRTTWTSTTIELTAGVTAIIPHVKATNGNGRMDSGYTIQIAVFKIA